MVGIEDKFVIKYSANKFKLKASKSRQDGPNRGLTLSIG